MVQTEIIYNVDDKQFIEDLNYFLEKLGNHRLIDIKFFCLKNAEEIIYQALIVYQME